MVENFRWENFLQKASAAGFNKVVLKSQNYILHSKPVQGSNLIAANPFQKLLLHAYSVRDNRTERLVGGALFGVVAFEYSNVSAIVATTSVYRRVGNAYCFRLVISETFWEELAIFVKKVQFINWPPGTPTPDLRLPTLKNENKILEVWLQFVSQAPKWVRNFVNHR